MAFLLDVNVLIALVDPAHVHHELTHDWFVREGSAEWAICPLTENGALRILGSPRYPRPFGGPAAIAPILGALRSHPGHRFWPDSISLLDTSGVAADRLPPSAHLTDTYLLALAASHRSLLATLDRRLVTSAVEGGAGVVRLIA